jgi:RNA polymerase sigma-70 factor (ECF subfamily)
MSDGMDGALADACRSGRLRWPGVDLPRLALAGYVANQAISEKTVRERADDLFLAAACAAGHPAAIAAFDREYLQQTRSYVGRLSLSEEMLDEVRQELRVHLLVDRPPRICGYKGTGPLGAWIRVVAVRIALDLLDASQKHGPVRGDHGDLAARVSATVAPEAELARNRMRPLLEAALEHAIGALPDRDKAILRFHYVEGLNVDAVGSIYRVHRATVARWLVDIRDRLLQQVQDRLAINLRMSPSEFRSVVGAMREDLRLSIGRVLGR